MTFELTLPAPGSRAFDVVTFGENSLDHLAVFSAWPVPDGKAALQDLREAPGGQAATAAVACARLGCRARYVGVFGDDRQGSDVRAAMAKAGVDVVPVIRAGARSRSAIILVDAAGRRSVLEQRDPRLALTDGEVEPAVFQSGRVLLVDTTDIRAAKRAAQAAREAGTRVIVDVEGPVPGLEGLVELADVVIAAAQPAAAYGGEPAAAYESEGAAAYAGAAADRHDRLVVTTLGAAGSVARYQGREIRTPAFNADVVDTTGAGDAIRAGFTVAWLLSGDGANLQILLEYASAVGALNCRALGAQTALPTRSEVDRLLACNGGGGRGV